MSEGAVLVEKGADPWVLHREGYYYYCFADKQGISVVKAETLQDIGKEKGLRVWFAPKKGECARHIWAPELHCIEGKWYIYFAADNGRNKNHRMFVLESESDDPQGSYVLKGKIADPSNKWAIDGTVFHSNTGQNYFIWSGWEGDENIEQNLYIAKMANPWTISSERVLISRPEYGWERNGFPHVNEGPQILRKNDRVHLIYSASGSWTDDYCLGQLTLLGDDPMDPKSWKKKTEPVFSSHGEVFAPGHASFVPSCDGKEDWIVYHAANKSGAGWKRHVRAKRFEWDGENMPVFGLPV